MDGVECKIRLSPPNPKQALFLKDHHKYVAFGGARGGGKSWAVRTKAILLAVRYPGIRLLIVRRSYPELMNNHIDILRGQLTELAGYNDKEKVLNFINGSRLHFMYCAKDADLDRLQGVEYDIIFLDEATQLSEWQMKAFAACIRGVNNFPKRMYFTCNPGGQGHAYIKRLFITKIYYENEDPADYSFIQSLVTDNRVLMDSQPDYINQLKALPPKLRKAWLYGDWNIFEGQFFEEFIDDQTHYHDGLFTHVVAPFEIPSDWRIYRSFDWGYSKPFSCGWWAVEPDGKVYRILEMYGCNGEANTGVKWTADKVFREIRRVESEHRWLKNKKIIGVADPAIWNSQTGESVAETAAKNGIYFQKGDHSRLSGWLQVHYRLAFDENGKSMMAVFSNCKAFIRTFPLLQYSKTVPEDLETEGEDHVADEVRYFLMARPIGKRQSSVKQPCEKEAVSIFLDIEPSELLPAPQREKIEFLS